MINKWFLSNNGRVVGPLTFSKAAAYLAENPNLYGWNPSLTQWKPASCIDEFASIIPKAKPIPIISTETIEKFRKKQNNIEVAFKDIDEYIKNSVFSLEKFGKKIEQCIILSENIPVDVSEAVNHLTQKYINIKKRLSTVKNAINIANQEMLDAVDDFDTKMDANIITMPFSEQKKSHTAFKAQLHTLDSATDINWEEQTSKKQSMYRGAQSTAENITQELEVQPAK